MSRCPPQPLQNEICITVITASHGPRRRPSARLAIGANPTRNRRPNAGRRTGSGRAHGFGGGRTGSGAGARVWGAGARVGVLAHGFGCGRGRTGWRAGARVWGPMHGFGGWRTGLRAGARDCALAHGFAHWRTASGAGTRLRAAGTRVRAPVHRLRMRHLSSIWGVVSEVRVPAREGVCRRRRRPRRSPCVSARSRVPASGRVCRRHRNLPTARPSAPRPLGPSAAARLPPPSAAELSGQVENQVEHEFGAARQHVVADREVVHGPLGVGAQPVGSGYER